MENFNRPLPLNESEGSFRTVGDGTKIFVHTRLPESEALASIYFISGITGINHLAEKDVIEALSAGKNRIVIIHPRGTGYSEGRRGGGEDFAKFISDFAEIINDDLALHKTGNKTILFGHSMSTAVLLQVSEIIDHLDGAILVNPPFRRKVAKGMTPAIRDYAKYAFYYLFAPYKPIVDMAGNPALIEDATDRREAEARSNDPLLIRYFSLYYMSKTRKIISEMVEKARKADYPLLLIYGDKDSLIEKSGCDEIFKAWKSPYKQFEVIKDGPHGKLTVLKGVNIIQKWISTI